MTTHAIADPVLRAQLEEPGAWTSDVPPRLTGTAVSADDFLRDQDSILQNMANFACWLFRVRRVNRVAQARPRYRHARAAVLDFPKRIGIGFWTAHES
jgi:hypothetical protein